VGSGAISPFVSNATAKLCGGVSLWAAAGLLVAGPLPVEALADPSQCPSVDQTVRAIALEDDRKLPEVPMLSLDAAQKKFARQFVPLEATVSAEGVPFSASKMLAKLWALYGLAAASGECSPELARLLTTVAIVEFKSGNPVEGTTLAEAALSINDLSSGGLINDALVLHDQVGSASTDPAVAIEHMRAAVDLAPRDPTLAPLQRFGLRQGLGYALQEGKRSAEAQQVNAQLLADAERELGKDDAALLGVIENLAQNHYELKQYEASTAYLQRCLALAGKHQRPDVESRMLFQLGVLAHERGNNDEARRYMNERIKHARRNPGRALLDAAESSLAELEQRIVEQGKK
jgi:tetratricopeptide (TPR) repeat protein